MLLPHGYEGQGPEHSSARVERYLQLCAENNLQVCYPTTPAQYFHLLRRQTMQETVRPLIVITPKSLLRLPAASSTIEELTNGGFRPVIDDATVTDAKSITRIVLCSGKVAYDIDAARVGSPYVSKGSSLDRDPVAPKGSDENAASNQVAVIRLEQFYPFPANAVKGIFAKYPNAKTDLLDAGRAAKHGRLDVRRAASAFDNACKCFAAAHRPRCFGVTRDRLLRDHELEQKDIVGRSLGAEPMRSQPPASPKSPKNLPPRVPSACQIRRKRRNSSIPVRLFLGPEECLPLKKLF